MRVGADRRVVVVANGAAGRGRRGEVELLLRRLRERATDPVVVEGASASEVDRELGAALADLPGAVVACGGDGTAHLVLQRLAGTPTPLAVLPTGTGNDGARALEAPTDGIGLADAVGDLLDGIVVSRTVDTAEAVTADGTRRSYLTVLCCGFDSRVLERIARTGARSGTTLYLRSALAELRSFRPIRYRVTLDEVTTELDAMLVAVGNGASYGGGMRVCPDAVLDDGRLDVMTLAHLSRRRLLRLLPTVYRGTHVRHPEVRVQTAGTVRVEADAQIAYADGERLGALPVTVRVRPGSLRVIGPRTT